MIVVTVALGAMVSQPQRISERASGVATRMIPEKSVRVVDDGPRGATLEVTTPSGRLAGTLTMTTDAPPDASPRIVTPSFYWFMNIRDFDPTSIDHMTEVARFAVPHDDGTLGYVRKPFRVEPVPGVLVFAALIATAMAATLLLLRRGPVVLQFRLAHLIPSLIQSTLLTYWWLYWPGVDQRLPWILLQILLAYAAEAVISVWTERTWRIGLAPLPIVLSANLFAWFSAPGTIVVVLVAIASRAFLRRGGRHIFNPSAAGLTVAGLLSLVSSDYSFGGVFHTLALPPNMPELLVLLALIPQYRFRLVLVSVGGVIGLDVAGTFFNHPSLAAPGTLLAFALFATDPATIPRTGVGQLLFGLLIGSAMAVLSTLLTAAGYPDDFSKVFPIPLANFLRPQFDAIGERLVSGRWSLLAPQWNMRHIAVWLVLVVSRIIMNKPALFFMAPHWDYATPLVVYRSIDVPRCEDNPIFCRPFTFPQEIAGWMARRGVDQ